MSKFKVGDRVRFINKQHWQHCPLGGYGTVYSVFDEEPTVVADGSSSNDWNFYFGKWKDLELVNVVEEGGEVKPYQRKTYRLKKAMPGYKVGTLFQEQCDDGTQPYSVIGDQHGPYTDLDVKLEFNNRGHVEDNPQWFVEVFKVTPEYMTQAELDEWEAFKKRNQKPKAIRKPRAKKPVVKAKAA